MMKLESFDPKNQKTINSLVVFRTEQKAIFAYHRLIPLLSILLRWNAKLV